MMRFVFLCLLFLVPTLVFGVSDDFTVRTFIGADTTPPTTPTLITAIPLSTTQISLSWSTSTDDSLLSGYQVWRDAVQVATTTSVTFVDLGLTPSTTYSYTVRAFDVFGNYSSTSNAVATTTFAVAIVSTTTESNTSYGSRASGSVTVQVVPQVAAASVSFDTKKPTRYVLRYGLTSSYELGVSAGGTLTRVHKTLLEGLFPQTRYFYELIVYEADGTTYARSNGSFTTLQSTDSEGLPNVTNLRARVTGESVKLTWENPATDPSFSGVRIVRSHLFYPQHTRDGFLVFEGEGTVFTDTDAFVYGEDAYYTVFVYDDAGHTSSGAVVVVRRDGTMPKPNVSEPIATRSPLFLFSDVSFIQDGSVVQAQDLLVDGMVRVRIPYEKLPTHLKTVLFTIEDVHGEVSTYLLRANSEKTFYEAVFTSMYTPQTARGTLVLYDFTKRLMYTASGELVFSVRTEGIGSYTLGRLPVTLAIPSEVITFIFFLCLFSVISFLLLLRKRRTHR